MATETLTGLVAPELPYLAAFRAVCVTGSFTAAAARLGLSQPAVSYQVQKLEERLGARLIERGARALVLTAEGRRVLRFADVMLEELERVRVECGAAGTILDHLGAGSYDAAFVYKRRVSSALAYVPAYEEELVLIAAPGLAAEVGMAPLDDADSLARVPFVSYEECEYVFGRWFDTSFGSQPRHIRRLARFTEREEVIDFVVAGVGLWVVPRGSASAAIARGDVAVLYAAPGRACWNTVYFVTRAGATVRPRLHRLIELIQATATPGPALRS